MKIALGTLQDEFELSGEFQVFRGWRDHGIVANLDIQTFSPKGEKIRAFPFIRLKRGEFIFRKWLEQWDFIEHAKTFSQSVDVLHLFLPNPNFLWVADRVKKSVQIPVVVTCLGEKPEVPFGRWLDLFRKSFSFFSVRFLSNAFHGQGKFLCDKYLVGNQFLEGQLKKAGCPSEKISVSPILLPSESNPNEKCLDLARQMDKEPTFLYVGHFLPNKGLDVLLKSFSSLKDKSVRLFLAWSGLGDLSKVKKMVRDLGISDQVKIIEEPVHRGVLFLKAKALVLPFIVSFGQVSPPVLLLEAFRAGVPIIVSKFPSINEFGEEGKLVLYTDPNHWPTLRDKMNLILKDSHLEAVMRKNQREFFQNNTSFDFLEYYQALGTKNSR